MPDSPFETMHFRVRLKKTVSLSRATTERMVRKLIKAAFESSDWGGSFARVLSVRRLPEPRGQFRRVKK